MSVRKAFLWSSIGQGLSLLAMLVALVWLSRILSPREMGAYATGQAVNGILAALSALGLGAYIMRERILNRQVLGTAFTINFGLASALALLAFLGAPLIAQAAGDERITAVVRWISVVPLIAAFELLPQAMLQREMRFGAFAVVVSIRSIVGTAVAIAAALHGERYMCVAYASVAAAAASVIGSHIAAPGHLRVTPSLAAWRRMTVFGIKILSVSGISLLAMRVSELIMASILGLAALGIYSRASTVYNTIYANLFGALGKVLMARMAADQRAYGGLRAIYLAGLQVTLALMWPLLLGIAVLAGPAVHLVFGPEWLGAAGPLAILMVAQAVSMFFGMSYELFVLRDEVGRQARYETIRSLAGLSMFTVGCLYGFEAAALARLAEAILASAMYIPQIMRLADVSRKELLRIYGLNALVAAAAVAPSLLLMVSYRFSANTPLSLVGLSVVAGAAGWLIALHFVRHPLKGELLNIWNRGRSILRFSS